MNILVNDKELDLRSIPLTQGRETLVDAADYEWLSQWKWACIPWKHGAYVCRRDELPAKIVDGKKIRCRLTTYMHRDILKAPSGLEVDHKDGNGLHNWRSNLRIGSVTLNQGNQRIRLGGTSRYKGVDASRPGVFRTVISSGYLYSNGNSRNQHLGTFRDEVLAAQVYNYAALYRFGAFANLNPVLPVFPPQQIISRLIPVLQATCRSAMQQDTQPY